MNEEQIQNNIAKIQAFIASFDFTTIASPNLIPILNNMKSIFNLVLNETISESDDISSVIDAVNTTRQANRDRSSVKPNL